MADVFISYSRRDAAFVRELHAFLTAADKDVWVDWEDIPPASEWERDIGDNIDAADSFVFVVSRDSLASKHCAVELARAETGGKHIIPLACDGADPDTAPAGLRRLNWMACRPEDDRDAAFGLLTSALDADLEWARAHTWLLVRASKWDAHQDGSLLLRGSDLDDATQQLAANAGKEPVPTELQQRFLIASRHAASRRQRVTLGGVTLALVVALALGAVAFLQRNAAIRANNSSTSLALSSAADDQLASHLDVSLLLSLEAYRANPSVQAENSMISALEVARRAGVQGILRGHQGAVSGVSFSPDGHTVASAGEDGTVLLWDAHTHIQLGLPLKGHQGPVEAVAFSPDGHTLASAGGAFDGGTVDDGYVDLWDVRTHRQLGKPLDGRQGSVSGVDFSPDGHTLASAGSDGTVWLWDLRTRTRLGKPLSGDRVAFSPDGHTLATESNGTVLWDVRAHIQLGQPLDADKGDVSAVAFSPDGHTLATSASDPFGDGTVDFGRVILWDVRTHTQLGRVLDGHQGNVFGIAFSRDGHTLASAGRDDGTVWLWDWRTQTRLGPPLGGRQGSVSGVDFSPDGHTLASAGSDGTVWLWDVPTPTQIGQPVGVRHGPVRDLAFSPDGHTLASAASDGTVLLSDARTHTPLGRPLDVHQGSVDVVAFSPDGHTLAAASGGTVRLWDVLSHAQLGQPLKGHQGPVWAFSPDGHTLASVRADGSMVVLWDLRTPNKPGQPLNAHQDEGGVRGVAFSPDGSMLASAGSDGTVRLWDVPTHTRLGQPLRGHVGAVSGVAFSPDGSTLASAGSERAPLANGGEGTVRLWDVRTHTQLGQPLRGHQGTVYAVAFSPDGHMLASAGSERAKSDAAGHGTVRLWDARTHTQLGQPLNGQQGIVYDVGFSPDQRALASIGEDGTLLLWEGIFWHDRDDLRAQVCELVVGNLTKAEWAELAPGLAYRSICPA